MTTYAQEEEILKYAREAYERAKTGHWIDVRYSMSKAIDIIDKL